MKREFSAGVVVYHSNKKGIAEYLLLQYAGGHWDFPKGHIEGKETKQATALRELQEETGITHIELADDFEESFEYFFKNKDGELILKTVYFFMGESSNKQVTLSHEHIGFAWLAYEEAIEQLTFQNARQLLHHVHAYLHPS